MAPQPGTLGTRAGRSGQGSDNMADVSIGDNPGSDANYYSHVICRTRSGRLYAGGALLGGVGKWLPWWTYSDDNGSTWATVTYFSAMRPTWGFNIGYDYTGVCMAVDGGDNVHCAWRDTTNFFIYYTRLEADRLGWTTPTVIGTCTAAPHPPKVVIGSDNSVNVLYTQGTEATPATGWCVTSLDTGHTWKTRGYTNNGAGSVSIAGPWGACADNAGLIHAVYVRTDGTRVTLRYASYDPATQTFSADTEVYSSYRAIEPDIAVAVDGEMHVSFCGRKLGDSFLNLMYAKYPVGGPWQVSALTTESVGDCRQTCCACWYDPNQTDYVVIAARLYDAGAASYEIRGTYSSGPNHNLWSTILTYSDTTLANYKAYPGFVYQRFPYIHDIPISGFGLSYLRETNYDFRYTSWEGIIGSSTPATWNPWHPIEATIKPKV